MIRILIADDHAIVREGLKQILADSPDMVVAGEAGSGQDLLQKIGTARWDVIVLDLSLPDRSGLDLLKQVNSLYPELPVLVLTIHAEEQYAVRALRAGASGFLTKDSAPDQLVTALQKVIQGGKYLSPALAEKLAIDLATSSDQPPHHLLSDREFQVLCLMASGKTPTEIAGELCLSVKTVSTHRTRILRKMGMRSNADLIRYALVNRLVPG